LSGDFAVVAFWSDAAMLLRFGARHLEPSSTT